LSKQQRQQKPIPRPGERLMQWKIPKERDETIQNETERPDLITTKFGVFGRPVVYSIYLVCTQWMSFIDFALFLDVHIDVTTLKTQSCTNIFCYEITRLRNKGRPSHEIFPNKTASCHKQKSLTLVATVGPPLQRSY
jgi:hypothetical protein